MFVKTGSTVGKVAYVDNVPLETTLNPQLVVLKDIKCNSFFLSCLLETTGFQNKIRRITVGGAVPTLSQSAMGALTISVPSRNEQAKIAELLSLINKRIIIQNKVIEDLKSINRTIINRVFGSIIAATIPLYEVASRITERNVDSKVKNVLTISARDGLVSQLDFFNKTVASSDLSKYFLLKRGDFAYNKSYSSDYPWGAIKHLDFYDVGVLSPLYFCFRPNKSIVDTTYLQFYFSTDIWHKHIAEIAVEGARNHGLLNMSISDFMQMPVPVPDMTEQLAISQALKIMSDKLNVEEEYAKAINQQKQYLLGQLFL